MGCFSCSALESIDGIDDVVSIGECAFEFTKLKSLDLFDSNVIMIGAHAFNGIKMSSIQKPYYMDYRTFRSAFSYSYEE